MIETEFDDVFNPVRCFLRRALWGAAEDFRRQRNATFVARVSEYFHYIGVQFIRSKFMNIHRNSKSFVFYPNRVIMLIDNERKSDHGHLPCRTTCNNNYSFSHRVPAVSALGQTQ